MRIHRGQTVPNYPGLCHSFSRCGPQSFPSLNKIVVFDDLCVVKETGHYQELKASNNLGGNVSFSAICFIIQMQLLSFITFLPM